MENWVALSGLAICEMGIALMSQGVALGYDSLPLRGEESDLNPIMAWRACSKFFMSAKDMVDYSTGT